MSTIDMASGYRDQSSLVAAFGLLVAIVAIVGTQYFDWEWGSEQLVPTVVGVVVAVVVVLVVARRALG